MMLCWSEEPDERPSFSDIVKIVENRMGAIAGYLDVGYNPFTNSQECNDVSTEPPPEPKERKKPPIKPRTKKPTVYVRDEANTATEDEHDYY